MPPFVLGLPTHVLVVHAVVVLVPLAVFGAVVVAVWPAARRRLGWVVLGVTAVATLCIPLATTSGEQLGERLVPTQLIEQHEHLGDGLLVFVATLLVAVAALVSLDHVRTKRQAGTSGWAPSKLLLAGLSALVVAAAAVSAVQVVRIGDSGARAAWTDTHYIAPQLERGESGD